MSEDNFITPGSRLGVAEPSRHSDPMPNPAALVSGTSGQMSPGEISAVPAPPKYMRMLLDEIDDRMDALRARTIQLEYPLGLSAVNETEPSISSQAEPNLLTRLEMVVFALDGVVLRLTGCVEKL